jgi:hypothetical protein
MKEEKAVEKMKMSSGEEKQVNKPANTANNATKSEEQYNLEGIEHYEAKRY